MHVSPRAAYVHIPFCSHRCAYCNFTVVADRLDLVDDYLKAIEIELSQLAEPCQLDTLFLGGGTPTELDINSLHRLLQLLAEWLPLGPNHEFSIEANPETFDRDRAQVLLAAGVNRISLGVQSFCDGKLHHLDRHHGATAAHAAITLAKSLFDNVSVDLIFAAPYETLATWKRDVRAALAHEVQHVSTYGLTYEMGTAFWSRLNRNTVREAPDHLQRAMYEFAIDELTRSGFEHYEVSNFALPTYRCRHNETYWYGERYLAFGPGASRYVDNRRETNHRSTSAYLKRLFKGDSPVAERDELTAVDQARERLIFGCRRLEGIVESDFCDAFGISPTELAGEAIDRFVRQGLMERADGRLRLTREGLLVSDGLWPDFL